MSYGSINADVIGTSVQGYSLGAGNSSLMKNKIINGSMVIDQRNAGASVTPTTNNQFTLDRWATLQSVASKFSVQQNAGSVTPPVGFSKYLGVTSLSAYSVATSDYLNIQQAIEGNNIADLGWGTANAKTVTLSFQVYSSLTGTFGGAIANQVRNRSYPFNYSIPVANTWTTISITIAGDTTGTWANDNTVGMYVQFSLGTGTTYSGTAGAWAGTSYVSATGATSVVGTNGATFYITGVQLEVGSSATGFEYVNYQTSLANCQRYYQQIGGNSYVAIGFGINSGTTQTVGTTVNYVVSMRTAPTTSIIGTLIATNRIGYDADVTSISTTWAGLQSATLTFNHNVAGTSDNPEQVAVKNNNSYLALSAEL